MDNCFLNNRLLFLLFFLLFLILGGKSRFLGGRGRPCPLVTESQRLLMIVTILFAKDHGKNYVKFRLLPIYHLLRDPLFHSVGVQIMSPLQSRHCKKSDQIQL